MIYLDYSANTPVDEAVLQRFCEVERNCPAMPIPATQQALPQRPPSDAAHPEPLPAVSNVPARRRSSIHSGASEANNFALKGLARLSRHAGRHIISTPLEHSSVSGT